METEIKLRLFTSQNQLYMNILIELRSQLGWFNEGKDAMVVPFVLTCAAALECTLNDIIIRDLDSEPERSLVNGYLSMNLRGKLTNVVPIATGNEFHINQNHKTFLYLSELISIRNRLVHNKSSHEIHDGVIVEEPCSEIHVRVQPGVAEGMNDLTFGLKKCAGRFHDALEDFHKKFYECYGRESFVGNDLIVPTERYSEKSNE